jgi:hypothetical protein
VSPALSPAWLAPRLPAPAAWGLAGQPVSGPCPAPVPLPAGPAARSPAPRATARGGVEAAADGERPSPMSAVRSRSAEAEPSASPDRPGPALRSFLAGADLGRLMTQHWTGRLPRGSRDARAALAPRDPGVSAASRAASGRVLPLRWCAPGAHHEGGVTPRFHLWAPVHRPSWTLTSPTSHDTIPLRIRRAVVQRLSATALYPSWRTTRDTTLFVRHQ